MEEGGQEGPGCAGRGSWGICAYLSEPVSAFSVANYPETAFRRAHTRMSSSRCAASCGKRRRQVAAALAGPEALFGAGDRRKEVQEWEPGTDRDKLPKVFLSPMDPCKEAPVPVLVRGEGAENRTPSYCSLTGTYRKKKTTQKIQTQNQIQLQRLEGKSTGQSESLGLSQSTALSVLRLCRVRLPRRSDPGGPDLQSASTPAPLQWDAAGGVRAP